MYVVMQTKIFYSHYTYYTDFFSFFIIFFRDRMQPVARTSLAVTFWKKRMKKIFFDYYSFFQPRIKCISTSHSKCDTWLIF